MHCWRHIPQDLEEEEEEAKYQSCHVHTAITFHRCPQNDGQAIASKPQGLRFNRILYAHDIIEDLSFEIKATTLADMGLRVVDAVQPLKHARRNQWNFEEGERGSIYIHDAAERDHQWEFQQAMDKGIKATDLGWFAFQMTPLRTNGYMTVQ